MSKTLHQLTGYCAFHVSLPPQFASGSPDSSWGSEAAQKLFELNKDDDQEKRIEYLKSEFIPVLLDGIETEVAGSAFNGDGSAFYNWVADNSFEMAKCIESVAKPLKVFKPNDYKADLPGGGLVVCSVDVSNRSIGLLASFANIDFMFSSPL